VIPYLHVTTRIEGHPYDGLLKEKGFAGFPSLCFMDASGNVIAKPGERSVASFEKTLGQVTEVAKLRAEVEGGRKELGLRLLVAEWRLGGMDLATTKKRAEALPKLGAADQEVLDQLLFDAEILALAIGTEKAEKFETAAAHYKKVLAEGKRMPSEWSERPFWNLLMRKADMEPPDPELYEKAVAAQKRIHAGNPNMAAYLEKIEARLAELKKQPGS